MAKVVIFFGTLLVLVLVFAITITPANITQKDASVILPIFDFKKYEFFKISKNGLEEYMQAMSAKHFKEKDIAKGVLYTKEYKNNKWIIISDFSTIKKDIISFKDNVVIKRDDGFLLQTKNIKFYRKTKKIKGFCGFFIKTKEGGIKGASFVVDLDKKILRANKIKAYYVFKEKN